MAGTPAAAAASRPSRDAVLADPRSGAKPLPGSPSGPHKTAAGGSSSTAPRPQPVQQQPAQQPPPAATQPQRKLKIPTLPWDSGGAGSQLAGGVLAVFLWPMVFNTVKGGPRQLWGWIKAKWINEPYQPGRGQGPTATTVQGGGTRPKTTGG